jgi:hypothetical protein
LLYNWIFSPFKISKSELPYRIVKSTCLPYYPLSFFILIHNVFFVNSIKLY